MNPIRLRKTGKRLRGFSLVELLVAIGIGIVLFAIVGYALNNTTKAANRTLALLDLHQKAGAIMNQIRLDFMLLQPHVAMDVDRSDPTTCQITFMKAVTRMVRGEGNYTSGTYRHELVWVRWEYDADDKVLRKGQSPEPAGYYPHHTYGSPTPQQKYEYFDNEDFTTDSGHAIAKNENYTNASGSDRSSSYNMEFVNVDKLALLGDKKQFYSFNNNYYFEDRDCFNPTYFSARTFEPQITPVIFDVESCEFTFYRRDMTTKCPDDETYDGIEMDGSVGGDYSNRPAFLRVKFKLKHEYTGIEKEFEELVRLPQ